jgi:serine protease Do
MLKKILFFILLITLAYGAISAQDKPAAPVSPATPVPVPRPERGVFRWSDDSGYLGIQTVAISNDNFAKFGLREVRGVGVEKVVENSPAAQAGLQNNDVIIRIDGEEVKSSAKLSRLIGEIAPDQKARITVLRGGSEQELTATIGKRPMPTFERFGALGNMPTMPTPPTAEFKLDDKFFENLPKGELPAGGQSGNFVWNFSGGRKIGVIAESLTKQLGEKLGVSDGKGLLVMEVRENSPAAKAGIKAGDIITEVDGAKVGDSTDLVHAVNAKKDGDVELTFVHDGNRQKTRVTPEQSKDEAPMVFGTPGPNSLRQTLIAPGTPVAPETLAAPGAIQTIPAMPALPAMPAVRVFNRVI